MALYTYKCPVCEHVNSFFRPMSECDLPVEESCEHCKIHTKMNRCLEAPMLVDPFRLGRMPQNGLLREKLRTIHETTHGSNLDKSSTLTKI